MYVNIAQKIVNLYELILLSVNFDGYLGVYAYSVLQCRANDDKYNGCAQLNKKNKNKFNL
ncbi:hypothetical protein DERP_007738 [Dermatophagoides pteronyssinus]|uniref:Uncharacterized protein n=1 Tax=Dermatophagoides pteronyssinus TaxID=6956 RepID=A0ABQ8JKK5_DERPT|nr:hypothetical protein DERP_007738 [Dermatophagoides pteronyssinus]